MVTSCFKMFLNPGQLDEYTRRHDALWPELSALLKGQGIVDYRIYFDADTDQLIALLSHDGRLSDADLKAAPIMQHWWKYMAELMQTHANNEPISVPLTCVFTLD